MCVFVVVLVFVVCVGVLGKCVGFYSCLFVAYWVCSCVFVLYVCYCVLVV